MKKIVLLLFATLMISASMNAQSMIDAYIVDSDGPVTNIRNSPKGKVVATLSTDDNIVVSLLEVKGKWWKIDKTVLKMGDDEKEITLKGSKTGYWIHRSLLGFTINGDPTGVIKVSPSKKAKSVKISNYPDLLLNPVAVKGKWVKVLSSDGKYIGWMPIDRICDNPLTTCP